MKRIHYALVAAMLCAASVSACKKDEAPAPVPAAEEAVPVDQAAMPAPAESTLAPVESVATPAPPASVEAASPDDMPQSGGDKVGG